MPRWRDYEPLMDAGPREALDAYLARLCAHAHAVGGIRAPRRGAAARPIPATALGEPAGQGRALRRAAREVAKAKREYRRRGRGTQAA